MFTTGRMRPLVIMVLVAFILVIFVLVFGGIGESAPGDVKLPAVCVLVYDDQDDNWGHDVGEPLVSGAPVTATSTATWTPTEMATGTATATSTTTPTGTFTPSPTPTDTATATWTPTEVATDTATATPTVTPTATPTATVTPTETATATPTATSTVTPLPLEGKAGKYFDLCDGSLVTSQFVGSVVGGSFHLLVNGTKVTTILGDHIEPAWSPSCDQIAFALNRLGMYRVYVINPDGSNLQQITFEGSHHRVPQWLSETRLAYSEWLSGSQHVIHVVDVP